MAKHLAASGSWRFLKWWGSPTCLWPWQDGMAAPSWARTGSSILAARPRVRLKRVDFLRKKEAKRIRIRNSKRDHLRRRRAPRKKKESESDLLFFVVAVFRVWSRLPKLFFLSKSFCINIAFFCCCCCCCFFFITTPARIHSARTWNARDTKQKTLQLSKNDRVIMAATILEVWLSRTLSVSCRLHARLQRHRASLVSRTSSSIIISSTHFDALSVSAHFHQIGFLICI